MAATWQCSYYCQQAIALYVMLLKVFETLRCTFYELTYPTASDLAGKNVIVYPIYSLTTLNTFRKLYRIICISNMGSQANEPWNDSHDSIVFPINPLITLITLFRCSIELFV